MLTNRFDDVAADSPTDIFTAGDTRQNRAAIRMSPRRDYLFVVGWIVLGCCCLPMDVPLARYCLDGLFPGDIRGLFHRAEVFGHAYGMLAILVTIYLLDTANRWRMTHLVISFLAAGLTADLIKLQIWRMRPRHFIEQGLQGSTFVGTVWHQSGVDWSELLDHRHHSFPSAHTAGAVAMAASLGQLYPAGRTWFWVLAALCGMNRIDGGAHYASDVCWGAAVGFLTFLLLPSADRFSAWLERRLGRRATDRRVSRPWRNAA